MMSTQEMPPFTDEERHWMEGALVYMPPMLATRAFLCKFPHYTDDAAFHDDKEKYDQIEQSVHSRFIQALHNEADPSYKAIQDRIAEYNKHREPMKPFIDKFPLLDPIFYGNAIAWFMQQGYWPREKLTVSETLKLLKKMREIHAKHTKSGRDSKK